MAFLFPSCASVQHLQSSVDLVERLSSSYVAFCSSCQGRQSTSRHVFRYSRQLVHAFGSGQFAASSNSRLAVQEPLFFTAPHHRRTVLDVRAAAVSAADLRELLQSKNSGDRIKAIRQTADLKDDRAEAVDILIAASTDDNPQVRYYALSKIADFGDLDIDRIGAVLFDRLKNEEDVTAKAAAADSVAVLKLDGAFDALMEVYHSGKADWVVRMSILAALGEMGDARAFDVLQEVVSKGASSGDDLMILTAALGALGDLGDTRAIEVVRPLIDHEELQVSQRARVALEQLTAA